MPITRFALRSVRGPLLALVLVVPPAALRAQSDDAPRTPATAPATDDWRERLRAFAEERFTHSAWGASHSRRNYELARSLAQAEGLRVDDDALYAGAYLHDMAAYAPFAKEGVDHGVRAAALVDSVLRPMGFPVAKLATVQDIVSHHMYYHEPGATPEAVCLRDADTLDFLGAIGVARVLSLTTRHRWATTLPIAVATLRRNMTELPPTLRTAAAKREGEKRVAEMRGYLDQLAAELGSAASP